MSFLFKNIYIYILVACCRCSHMTDEDPKQVSAGSTFLLWVHVRLNAGDLQSEAVALECWLWPTYGFWETLNGSLNGHQ